MSFILRSARKVGSLFFQCIFFGYIDKAYSLAEAAPQQKEHHAGNPVYFDLDGTLMKMIRPYPPLLPKPSTCW